VIPGIGVCSATTGVLRVDEDCRLCCVEANSLAIIRKFPSLSLSLTSEYVKSSEFRFEVAGVGITTRKFVLLDGPTGECCL
jgi:hypothetical protein